MPEFTPPEPEKQGSEESQKTSAQDSEKKEYSGAQTAFRRLLTVLALIVLAYLLLTNIQNITGFFNKYKVLTDPSGITSDNAAKEERSAPKTIDEAEPQSQPESPTTQKHEPSETSTHTDPESEKDTDDTLTEVEKQEEAEAEKTESVKEEEQGLQGTHAPYTQMEETVTSLRTAVATLEKRLQANEQQIAHLKAQNQQRTQDTTSENLLVLYSVWNLEEQLQTGKAFTQEAQALREQVSTNAAEIETLIVHGKDSIKSLSQLQHNFATVASHIIKTQAEISEPEDGWQWLKKLLARWISVRRTTVDTETNPTETALAHIESHLQTGDLASAIKEAEALQQQNNEHLITWINEAKARHESLGALRTLKQSGLQAVMRNVSPKKMPLSPQTTPNIENNFDSNPNPDSDFNSNNKGTI